MAYSLATLPRQYCRRQTTDIFSNFPQYFSMQIIPFELVHYKTLAL